MLPRTCGIAKMGPLSFFRWGRGVGGGTVLVSRDAVLVLVPDKKGMRAGIEDWYSMGAQIRTDLLQYRYTVAPRYPGWPKFKESVRDSELSGTVS